jgi:hypothetical protein
MPFGLQFLLTFKAELPISEAYIISFQRLVLTHIRRGNGTESVSGSEERIEASQLVDPKVTALGRREITEIASLGS